jgi:hypothetical protein
MFFSYIDFEINPINPKIYLKQQVNLNPGTTLTNSNKKSSKNNTVDDLLNYSFWLLGAFSMVIWLVMCVKDALD